MEGKLPKLRTSTDNSYKKRHFTEGTDYNNDNPYQSQKVVTDKQNARKYKKVKSNVNKLPYQSSILLNSSAVNQQQYRQIQPQSERIHSILHALQNKLFQQTKDLENRDFIMTSLHNNFEKVSAYAQQQRQLNQQLRQKVAKLQDENVELKKRDQLKIGRKSDLDLIVEEKRNQFQEQKQIDKLRRQLDVIKVQNQNLKRFKQKKEKVENKLREIQPDSNNRKAKPINPSTYQISQFQERQKRLNTQLLDAQQEIQRLQKMLSKYYKEILNLNKQLECVPKLQQQLQATKADNQQLKVRLQKQKNSEIKEKDNQTKSLKVIKQHRKLKSKKQPQSKRLSSSIISIQKSVISQPKSSTQHQNQIKQLKTTIKNLQQQLSAIKSEFQINKSTSQQQHKQSLKKIDILIQQKEELTKKNNQKDQARQNLEIKNNYLQQECNQYKDKVMVLSQDKKDMQNEHKKYKQSYSKYIEQIDQLLEKQGKQNIVITTKLLINKQYKLIDQFQKLEKENTVLIEDYDRRNKQLLDKIGLMEKQLKKMEKNQIQLEEKKQTIQKQLKIKGRQLANKGKQEKYCKYSLQNLETRLSEARLEADNYKQQLQNSQEQSLQIKKRLQSLQQQFEQLKLSSEQQIKDKITQITIKQQQNRQLWLDNKKLKENERKNLKSLERKILEQELNHIAAINKIKIENKINMYEEQKNIQMQHMGEQLVIESLKKIIHDKNDQIRAISERQHRVCKDLKFYQHRVLQLQDLKQNKKGKDKDDLQKQEDMEQKSSSIVIKSQRIIKNKLSANISRIMHKFREIQNQLQCKYCDKMVQGCIRALYCGHVYCSQCLKNYKEGCIQCNEVLKISQVQKIKQDKFKVFEDQLLDELVAKIKQVKYQLNNSSTYIHQISNILAQAQK